MKSMIKMLLNLFKKKVEKKVEEVKEKTMPAPKQEVKAKPAKKYYNSKPKSKPMSSSL